jgi:MFS family permease
MVAYQVIMAAGMFEWARRLNPFKTREARRLAFLFGVVYFAQGMWYLPNQTITILLKDRGLTAGQVADFFLISTIPWLIKPLYGLLSDFVPLFGRRRQSYFILTSGLAGFASLVLASGASIAEGPIETVTFALPVVGTMRFTLIAGVGLFTLMAFGLAFTDVLTDAMMVEHGRPRGLTGAFQSVQWACITVASVLVGLLGGYLAEYRSLQTAFLLAAAFPVVSLLMGVFLVREPPSRFDAAAIRATSRAIREALAHRDMWVVAGFILFWTFSPSFGPAFLYYQTDALKFSQQFIGVLGSLAAIAGVVGAAIYAPLSRRLPLKSLINGSIGAGVVATLAYLVYRGTASALLIDITFGCVGMITQLALLDLAAKSCPRRVEATFFALLMSVYNGGTQLSQNVGARLYDALGYTPLVLISAALTAAAWLLVPLVRIDRIEARAREEAEARAAAEAAASL